MIRSTQFLNFEPLNQQFQDHNIQIVIASELQQVTHSFKFRAAWSLVNNIDAQGFCAASSGNFGQALACACQHLGRKCSIVMPTTSAKIKVDAVRSYGAEVVFVDTAQQSRAEKLSEVATKNPSFYVASAYDCDWVIQGNSSLGKEIAKADLNVDTVMVPVGGGGLISGIALGIAQMKERPKLWGAEPEMADDAYRSLKEGQLIRNVGEPQTLADGARTVSVGLKNWNIIQKHVSGIVRVSENAIIEAMKYYHQLGLRVEPTGALTLGAIIQNPTIWKDQKILLVISGGNVDVELYDRIIGTN